MKFENIKVGDTVVTQASVRYGWNSGKSFYIPVAVKKVTPTQFTTENGKRFKKDGRGIGDERFKNVYYLGDKSGYHGANEIVKDQTKEMNYFISKLKLERSIIDSFEKLTLSVNSDFTIDQLNALEIKVSEINSILKKSNSNC